MEKYKDFLGTEIKVGDVVTYVSSAYATFYIGMVTKRNPVKVQINGHGGALPSQCLVVTEQYKADHHKKYQKLLDVYSPRLLEGTKIPNPKMRYEVHLKEDPDNGKVSVMVLVSANGVLDKVIVPKGSRGNTGRIARNVKFNWRRDTVTDTLCIFSGDYARPLGGSMPAKYIKRLFGGVPPESEVVMTFDDIVTCGEYFKAKGVAGEWKT